MGKQDGPRMGMGELLELALQLKAVFVDLDGTLLAADHTMPERALETVRLLQATGVRVVPASGRTLQSIRSFFGPVASELDMVASNGMDVIASGKCIYHATCPTEDARALLDAVLASKRRLGMTVFTEAGPYIFDREADFVHERIESLALAPVQRVNDGLPAGVINKVAVIAVDDTAGAVRELSHAMGTRFAFTPCGAHFIDAAHGGIDKIDGVRMVMEHLGAGLHEVAAFGDSMNDLKMMEALPVSVAVANAMPELKAVCAYEIGSNAEGAVPGCFAQIAARRERAACL